MKTRQAILDTGSDFDMALRPLQALQPGLVLVFGALSFFESAKLAKSLYSLFPSSCIAGCSTGGEISNGRAHDNTCIVTAVRFEHAWLAVRSTVIDGMADSRAAGGRLGTALAHHDLSAVLLLAPGVAINGSALVAGLQEALPAGVTVSGGLAADAGAFRRTLTLDPDGIADNRVVAVGIYGQAVRVACGSSAGWATFGPERQATRCDGNILYELDGKRALDIYKQYLGIYARDLPGSALLFPFEVLGPGRRGSGVYRTIIGMNDEEGSLTLAGDVAAGAYLKLMHASTDMLVDGAATAARRALAMGGKAGRDSLAVLVSCIGRALVMGDRKDDEVEAVASLLGSNALLAGFYSNGEISISGSSGFCVNNQTMSIAWIRED